MLGNGLAMVLGPFFVPDNGTSSHNKSEMDFMGWGSQHFLGEHHKNETPVEHAKEEINSYMQVGHG